MPENPTVSATSVKVTGEFFGSMGGRSLFFSIKGENEIKIWEKTETTSKMTTAYVTLLTPTPPSPD
jgi:hypothetical protein